MRVALVHFSRGADGTPASPMVDHLGLESIAGNLLAEGHEVTLIDSGPSGLDADGILDALSGVAPELVGFALNYANVRDVRTLVERTRGSLPKAFLVAGGHYATFHTESLLRGRAAFDAVVLGEGEVPMAVLAGVPASLRRTVPGLAWIEAGQVRSTPPLPPPALENLPLADRSSLHGLATLPRGCAKVAVEASRGCRHSCNFCSIAASQVLAGEAGRRRLRSPAAVAGQMAAIIRDWDLKDFWFMDADFLGGDRDRGRILALAESIGGLGQDITLEIDARADSVCGETIRALRAVGLVRAFLGVESFDQATLNSLGKGATVEGNLRAVRLLEEEGVRPILGSIMFHPESTLEQIRRDHAALRGIGYEKTQMLFRLKKYMGSRDASDLMDCEGRGISPHEDYGWEITDPQVRFVWELFDMARLKLMDFVFVDLTIAFKQGNLDSTGFQRQMDIAFSGLGRCMDFALDVALAAGRLNDPSAANDMGQIVSDVVRGAR